jgi:hypothetical protein
MKGMGAKMDKCCEGVPGEGAIVPEMGTLPDNILDRNTRLIHFSAMSPERQQAFTDYLQHGHNRHMKDIKSIESDLTYIKERWGMVPSEVYLCKEAIWHEVQRGE